MLSFKSPNYHIISKKPRRKERTLELKKVNTNLEN